MNYKTISKGRGFVLSQGQTLKPKLVSKGVLGKMVGRVDLYLNIYNNYNIYLQFTK